MWWPYLWVAVGSALGGVLRFACARAIDARIDDPFPWGTLAVNFSGSFVIGFVNALAAPDGRPLAGSAARQFVMAGVCGGYTTFSAFSLQTLELMHQGDWPRAGGNVVASVALCLAAVWLGHVAATALSR